MLRSTLLVTILVILRGVMLLLLSIVFIICAILCQNAALALS